MLLKVPFSFLHFSIPPSLALFLTCTFLILALPTHFLGDHPATPWHHQPIGEKPLALTREHLPHHTPHFPWDWQSIYSPSLIAKSESPADPWCGNSTPAHPVYFYSTWESVPGHWLGENRSEKARVRHSERGEAETHECQSLQALSVLQP